MMKKRALRTEPRALVLVERAIHLLRRNNWVALAEYFLGTLPFVLGLLYFWSDMSENPMAIWYCGPSAAGVALLFVWMKVWHVRFCRRLWCHLQNAAPERWTWRRTVSTAARQTALHATGVILLPFALLIFLPFGWVYAFYQNLCVLDDAQPKGIKNLTRDALKQAALWPLQNHIILLALKLFGFFVFLALGITLTQLPYLLKSILGIETVFTLSGWRFVLNTTFLAVWVGLTYLCLDPIFKTVYVLRCFHGRSQYTGDDLKSALRPFLKAGAVAITTFVLILPTALALADASPSEMVSTPEIDDQRFASQLDDHIESVLEQRRFAWRIPIEEVPEPPEDHGWISDTLRWIGEKLDALAKIVSGWIEDFFEWLRNQMSSSDLPPSSDSGDYRGMIRWIFYALGFGLALWLIYWMFRWFKNARPVHVTADDDQGPLEIDLSDESITAEDLPVDRWLSMAQEMLQQKDFRRALRALYLSVLAQLADSQRVKIARYKSNRDYAAELARRAHAEPELLRVFDWCIGIFERSWYGMHPVDRQRLDQFMDQQKRIAALVQPSA